MNRKGEIIEPQKAQKFKFKSIFRFNHIDTRV
jgi:antibiotic biosynthesis monooxygenase (ABM) superfamily enzyme